MPSLNLVVVPAAGLGTRLLPASLAVPKELLPLGVHPAILACLLEADAAGLRDLCVVLGPRKAAIRSFLDPACWPALPAELAEGPALAPLRALIGRLRLRFAEQPEPTGVRDAVERGQRAAGQDVRRDPCVVLYPDLLHLPDQRALGHLRAAHAACGGVVFGLRDAALPGVAHGATARVELREPLTVPPPPGAALAIRRLLPSTAPPVPGELRTTFGEVQTAALGCLLDDERQARGAQACLSDAAYGEILNRLAADGQLFGTLLPGEVLDLGTAAGYRDAAGRFASGAASLRELAT